MNMIVIPQTILDLLAFRIEGEEPWDKPLPIEFDLSAVKPFDEALLPDVLAEFVMDEAQRMQCPPDFVAVACLVMIGSVIGNACAVRPKQQDNWSEVPNLWGGFVGRPGMLKSPAMSAGLSPMFVLEREAKNEHNQAIAHYLMRKAEREFDLKQLKAADAEKKLKLSAEEIRQRILDLTKRDQTEKEPQLRRYRTNDATVEKIGEMAADSLRGLLYVRDELAGLLANCDKPGHEGDRSFFLEAWVGQQPFSTDRIGRGNVHVPRLCLSLFGGIQPDKLKQYIYGTLNGYDNDGLLQRFQLMVYPDEVKDRLYVDRPPNKDARAAVEQVVKVLASSHFISMGASIDGPEDIPYFRFCEAAQPMFVDWYMKLEESIAKQESPILAEHIGKYRKLIPALALIFHLVDLANAKKFKVPGISKESLKRAIAWHGYLLSHAQRIYGMAVDPLQPAVTTLAARIRSGKLTDGFSERDVYKAGWSHLTDPEIVSAACRELVMDHWLRRIPQERGGGRPASPAYRINPAI